MSLSLYRLLLFVFFPSFKAVRLPPSLSLRSSSLWKVEEEEEEGEEGKRFSSGWFGRRVGRSQVSSVGISRVNRQKIAASRLR